MISSRYRSHPTQASDDCRWKALLSRERGHQRLGAVERGDVLAASKTVLVMDSWLALRVITGFGFFAYECRRPSVLLRVLRRRGPRNPAQRWIATERPRERRRRALPGDHGVRVSSRHTAWSLCSTAYFRGV